MTDIGPADVAAFVVAQQRAGFKGWTIRGDLTVLGAIFTYASRYLGLVGGNPLATLDRVERPGVDDARLKRVLSPDELRRLIDAVDAPYRLLFELAAEPGCRLGEVLGLVWGDIDVEAGTVSFECQLDCKRRRAPLKTKRSRRSIEITEALTEKLPQAKIYSRANGRHDFVFVSTPKPRITTATLLGGYSAALLNTLASALSSGTTA